MKRIVLLICLVLLGCGEVKSESKKCEIKGLINSGESMSRIWEEEWRSGRYESLGYRLEEDGTYTLFGVKK